MEAILKDTSQSLLQNCLPRTKKEAGRIILPEVLFFVFLFLFLNFFQISPIVYADETVKVKKVEYSSTFQNTSIFIEMSDIAKVTYYRLPNPERIIINLKNANLMNNVSNHTDINDMKGLVKSIGIDQYEPDKVRIVVDLANKDSDYKVSLLKRPWRLGIEVFQKNNQVQEAELKSESGLEQKTAKNITPEVDDPVETKHSFIYKNEDNEKKGTSDMERSEGQIQREAEKADTPDLSADTMIKADNKNLDSKIDQEIPGLKIADVPPAFTSMDFQEYVKKVMDANPSVKINEQDYKEFQLKFLRDLQTYGFQLVLNSSASLSLEKDGTGADVRLDLTKTLYDGGKRQILEKEFEVVKALSRANLIESYDTIILIAVLHYTDFYYKQEVLDFLKEQFEQQKFFIDRVENSYQKGLKFSSYDFLTSQSDHLNLEKALVSQKTDFTKTDIAFRQFGHIYTEGPIKLAPLDVAFTTDMQKLQKYALVYNKSIYVARLRNDLQKYKIAEREAEGGITINAGSSLGLQAGTNEYTGDTNVGAGVFLKFSLPLYDSGVRKTEILTEQIESLKQRLTVQKTEEDVIKRINDIYLDYKTIGSNLKILDEQLSLNEKRLRISMERLEKGLDDYRAVRESWNDLIDTKIELIKHKTLEQKLLVDLLILSGMNLFH